MNDVVPPPVLRDRPASRFSAFLGFTLGFAVAAVMAGAVIWAWFFGTGPRIDMSRPTVIQHVHQLRRLETVVYSMEKIVSASQDSAYLPRMLAGDRILLIVYGEVTAGVDLDHLEEAQLRVSGRTVEIALPPAEIFSTRIDNARTRVYSRETGLFTSPDPNFESDVRREAERQVTQAAIDGGILSTAATNARTTLTTFFKGLGFEAVTFR